MPLAQVGALDQGQAWPLEPISPFQLPSQNFSPGSVGSSDPHGELAKNTVSRALVSITLITTSGERDSEKLHLQEVSGDCDTPSYKARPRTLEGKSGLLLQETH